MGSLSCPDPHDSAKSPGIAEFTTGVQLEAMTQPEILPSLTDEELVALAKKGRQRAFRELHQRYESRIFRFLCNLLGDPTTAEEAKDQAFEKAFLGIKKFSPKYKFRTWLFAIARNVARDRLKHTTVEKVGIHDDPLDNTSEIIASAAVQMADPRSGTADPVLLAELKAAIPQAAGVLTP